MTVRYPVTTTPTAIRITATTDPEGPCVILDATEALYLSAELGCAAGKPASKDLAEASYAMREIANCIDQGISAEDLAGSLTELGRGCLGLAEAMNGVAVINVERAYRVLEIVENIAKRAINLTAANAANEAAGELRAMLPKRPLPELAPVQERRA